MTHYPNAMSGLHHREIGLVGAGLLKDDLVLEVIADGIHKSLDFLRLLLHIKGPTFGLASDMIPPAFADNPDRFVYILEDFPGSLLPLSEAIFTICEVFSTTLKEQSRNVGSVIPHAVSRTSSILLRLYEQAQTAENAQIANRCLDIWDMLFENRVGIVRELTNAIEK